jgi:ATP-dependent protease ClpP protease subunit
MRETDYSNGPQDKTSLVSQPTYTYMAQEDIEPAEETAVPSATGSVKLDQSRLLTLSGIVDSRVFLLANRLVELAESGRGPIDIVISSPGGSVSHGLFLVQAIQAVKAKGVVVRCHVPTLAASMAYVVFTQCTERYALPYAQLLFHAPRVSGEFVITPQGAVELAKGLIGIQNVLFGLIVPVMGISQESGKWFMENYLGETLWTADQLDRESPVHWFKVVAQVKNYPGEFPAAYDKTSKPGRKALTPDVSEAGR